MHLQRQFWSPVTSTARERPIFSGAYLGNSMFMSAFELPFQRWEDRKPLADAWGPLCFGTSMRDEACLRVFLVAVATCLASIPVRQHTTQLESPRYSKRTASASFCVQTPHPAGWNSDHPGSPSARGILISALSKLSCAVQMVLGQDYVETLGA